MRTAALLAALAVAGCARNGSDLYTKKVMIDGGPDALVVLPPDATVDAAPIDAPADAPVDARPVDARPIDAP